MDTRQYAYNGQDAQQRDSQPLDDLERWNDIMIGAHDHAGTVLAALAFPAISSFMGTLLKYGLPVVWPSLPDQLCLLQTRWGRSVVGGCLFVLFKDFDALYTRASKLLLLRRKYLSKAQLLHREP